VDVALCDVMPLCGNQPRRSFQFGSGGDRSGLRFTGEKMAADPVWGTSPLAFRPAGLVAASEVTFQAGRVWPGVGLHAPRSANRPGLSS